jgi:hypothetical protein
LVVDDRSEVVLCAVCLDPYPPEETLVDDDRSGLTPAQAVESKLMSRIQGASMQVSHLQMRGLVRNRRYD